MNLFIKEGKQRVIPVHFIRFEDLISNTEETLQNLFCYVLQVNSIKGLNIERRIKEVV
jgi:hypothetical protein